MEITREDCQNLTLFSQLASFRTDLAAIKATLDQVNSGLQALANKAIYRILSDPVLAVATTDTKYKTTAALQYEIEGVVYTKAASDNIGNPGDTAAGEFRKDLISIDAGGTFTLTAGTPAASQVAAEIPDVPADNVPVGYIEVPESFTGGTTKITAGMLKRIVQAAPVSVTVSALTTTVEA